MANNILETVYGLGDDDTIKSLKRIDKIVGKLDTEKKKEDDKEKRERKQDKLHENRLAQLKKREKADSKKQTPITELMGKEKEKKGNDLWKWLLGAGVLGGGVLAWMNRDKIGKWFKNKFDEIKQSLSKKIIEWAHDLARKIRDFAEEKTTPQRRSTPQTPGSAEETHQGVEETFDRARGRAAYSSRTKVAKRIRRASIDEKWHYATNIGGEGEAEEKALKQYYDRMRGVFDDHLKLLEVYDNLKQQMKEQQDLLESTVEGSTMHTTILKRIADYQTNITITNNRIRASEKRLHTYAEEEHKLKIAENKAKKRDENFGTSIFTGTQWDQRAPGHQTGGVIGRKPRKDNGGENEMMMDPRLLPLKRQEGGKIFLHWAASRYNFSSNKYHATVQGDGSVKKERDYNSFGGGHTSGRNSEGIGLSLAAMYGAQQEGSFGQYPVKPNQYESMAKLAAQILTSWGKTPSYVTESNVQTHAEAANRGDERGGYGPLTKTPIPTGDYRWDLWKLYENSAPGTGGPAIRNMIRKHMGSGDFELETTDADGHTLPSMPAPARQKTFMEKLQEAFSALGNVGVFAGTVLQGIGSFLLEKLGFDFSGLFSMFGMGQPEQKQEGGLVKGNAKSIYDRLIMGGMSIPAARGILANIGVETGYTYDPKTVQDGGGPGRGLVQWEKGGRFDTDRINLVNFAKNRGTSWDDMNTQVDFILHEMNTHPEYMRLKPKLNTAKSTRAATELFLTDYEKAGKPHTDRRFKVADTLDKMNWQGPGRVGSKVGPKIVGSGNPVVDFFTGKQSGGTIKPSQSTTMRHTNFQENQQVFNQSRGAGRRQVVVVKRRAPQQQVQLPTPAPPQGILPSGGLNNIASINDMYSVVGMS